MPRARYTGKIGWRSRTIERRQEGRTPTETIIKTRMEKPMYDIRKLFVKSELVPAIVQDAATKDVLMLAYMNEESLRKTLGTGYTWFYSRSRGRLWRKGETSGNVQRVISVVPDCDDDTLLVTVDQTGVACHTGNWSCFFAGPIEEAEGREQE
jgi:phosphoribosyl-AMP cyclohydrolase/phosphoribosyl-ATP pyrophosphohydrolase/phosphoribosyl-AMP cyclohydrolase